MLQIFDLNALTAVFWTRSHLKSLGLLDLDSINDYLFGFGASQFNAEAEAEEYHLINLTKLPLKQAYALKFSQAGWVSQLGSFWSRLLRIT